MKVKQEPGLCILYDNQATGWTAARWWSIPGRDKGLFSKTSRLALESTQPSIQLVLETLSMGLNWPRPKDDHSPRLVPRLRVTAAIFPLPCKSSWRTQGHFYLM